MVYIDNDGDHRMRNNRGKMKRSTFLILLLVIALTAFAQEWELRIDLYTHPDSVKHLTAKTSFYGSDMYDSTVIVGPDVFVIDVGHPPPPPWGFFPYFPLADSIYSFIPILMKDGRSAYDDTIIWTIRWHCDYTESVTVEWDSTALPGYGSFGIEIESPRKTDGDNWVDMSSITKLTEIPFWSWVRMRFVNTTGITEETDCKKPNFINILTFPNPFNSAVTISAPAGAEIEIFDVNGRMVDKMSVGATRRVARSTGQPPVDPYETVWQPSAAIGSGVYLVRAKIGDESITKRVVYLK